MSLTSAQLEQFHQRGYVVVPHFFDPRQTRAIRLEVQRLQRVGKLRNVATAGDGQTPVTGQRNLQLCPLYQDSTFFRALPFAPQVVQAVQALIGDPVVLHLDQVFLKPGGDGMGTNWHQDNAYFRIADPRQGTAMWIAVHDATVANGTLRVIPDAWRDPFPHSRDPMSDHHIRMYPDARQESRAVDCEIQAGGVVFFCYGTPHATGPNRTDRDRAGVAYHFLTAEAIPGSAQPDYFKEPRDYRPYLTGPKASGGRNEYGTTVAGTWDQEIARVLADPAPAAV